MYENVASLRRPHQLKRRCWFSCQLTLLSTYANVLILRHFFGECVGSAVSTVICNCDVIRHSIALSTADVKQYQFYRSNWGDGVLFNRQTVSSCSLASLLFFTSQVRAQKFEKGGRGAQFIVYTFPLKISVKTKKKTKGLHVFRRPIYPLKSSEEKKKVNASSDVLFPLFR